MGNKLEAERKRGMEKRLAGGEEILICSDSLRHLLRDSNGLVSNRFRIIFGERIPAEEWGQKKESLSV